MKPLAVLSVLVLASALGAGQQATAPSGTGDKTAIADELRQLRDEVARQQQQMGEQEKQMAEQLRLMNEQREQIGRQQSEIEKLEQQMGPAAANRAPRLVDATLATSPVAALDAQDETK